MFITFYFKYCCLPSLSPCHHHKLNFEAWVASYILAGSFSFDFQLYVHLVQAKTKALYNVELKCVKLSSLASRNDYFFPMETYIKRVIEMLL